MIPPALGNDPLGDSNPPGLYRTLIYNRPFEMVQTPGKVVQLFEWAKIWRVIYTDGRPIPDDIPAGPYWYGYSVGKWEGDTLVVQTLGLDARAWLDESGNFPFSDEARIEERWKRTGPDKIELTITIHDPATYVFKPWTSSAVVYSSQRKTDVLEMMIFAPIDEKEFNKEDPGSGRGRWQKVTALAAARAHRAAFPIPSLCQKGGLRSQATCSSYGLSAARDPALPASRPRATPECRR